MKSDFCLAARHPGTAQPLRACHLLTDTAPCPSGKAIGCVVVWFHDEWQAPAYQVYAGLLFGLPLAVTSFNRFSRLLEALTRRYCQALTSLYFDDATITDVRSAN